MVHLLYSFRPRKMCVFIFLRSVSTITQRGMETPFPPKFSLKVCLLDQLHFNIFWKSRKMAYSLKVIRSVFAFLCNSVFIALLYPLVILICGLICCLKAILQTLTFMVFSPFFQFVSSIYYTGLFLNFLKMSEITPLHPPCPFHHRM